LRTSEDEETNKQKILYFELLAVLSILTLTFGINFLIRTYILNMMKQTKPIKIQNTLFLNSV
jgi:hypothetical protein